MTLTPADLARLKALAEKATPGPWAIDPQEDAGYFAVHGDGYDWVCNAQDFANARFIKSCDPSTIIALIELAEKK